MLLLDTKLIHWKHLTVHFFQSHVQKVYCQDGEYFLERSDNQDLLEWFLNCDPQGKIWDIVVSMENNLALVIVVPTTVARL